MNWIKVDERLPDEKERLYAVLVYCSKTPKGVMMAHWKGDKWVAAVLGWLLPAVSHWMPLPAAPE